jgi:hypothetical protein
VEFCVANYSAEPAASIFIQSQDESSGVHRVTGNTAVFYAAPKTGSISLSETLLAFFLWSLGQWVYKLAGLYSLYQPTKALDTVK